MEKKLKRLKALLGKEDLTADEKTELASLQSDVKAAGYNPETGDKAEQSDENTGMTEDDVKSVVVDAMKGIGLDADTLATIKQAIEAKSADSEGGLKLDDIKGIIEDKLGGEGIDEAALVKNITEAVSKSKGITPEELDAKLVAFGKQITKSASKMQFPGESEVEYPIEHRSGNMSVCEKQLLNLCLQGVSEEAIEQSGIKRPDNINAGIPKELVLRAKSHGERAIKSIRAGRKALTSGGTNAGAELVPTDLSSDLQRRLYLESDLAAEMISQEIQMPTPVFQLPISTTRPTFLVGSEGGTPTESSGGTDEITLTSKKLIGKANYSYEADEDSIIPILPMLQENLAAAAADALEGALINGDSDGTHQDADFEAVSGHHAKLFDGLRKYALGGSCTTSLATGGISASNIGSMRKYMKKYGIRPRDVFILSGVQGYSDLVQLDETLTVDKVGNNAARILTGEAGSLYGMRIIVSSQVREDVNAAGVQQGSVDTKGVIFLVHKPSWLLGVRRGFTVEVDVNKSTQINSVIASFRRAFTPKETPSAAAIQSVWMGYNFDAAG